VIAEHLDRLAGGRNFEIRIAEELRIHPRTRRAFNAVVWILCAELLVGSVAIVVGVVLAMAGESVSWAVWFRGLVVFGITVTLFYFVWRAVVGYYWAYSRLRLFSSIFPIVTLVIAAIPGMYPFWMIAQQVFFSFLLFGVASILWSDHMRKAFAKPARRALV